MYYNSFKEFDKNEYLMDGPSGVGMSSTSLTAGFFEEVKIKYAFPEGVLVVEFSPIEKCAK
jgi:hypothetical protein